MPILLAEKDCIDISFKNVSSSLTLRKTCLHLFVHKYSEFDLVKYLQAQTLSDAVPPIGKTHQFIKKGLTSEIKNLKKFLNRVYFMTESTISNPLVRATP